MIFVRISKSQSDRLKTAADKVRKAQQRGTEDEAYNARQDYLALLREIGEENEQGRAP